MVYSATYALSYMNSDGATRFSFFERQIMWVSIGAAAMLVCWWIDYRHWQKVSTIFILGIVAVLFLLFLIGQTEFGAQRWLVEGGSVQPSELAKLATIIYVAHWASSKGDKISSLNAGLIPFGVLIGLICGLIVLQPSFSTALIVGSVAATMFLVAGADLRQFFVTGLIGAVVIFFLATAADYRQDRIAVFQDPFGDPTGAGYQTTQVLTALARGGWVGEGLGTSKGNAPQLPAGHTDLIMAIVGQELGLLATVGVIVAFLFLAWRGFRVANTAPDGFGTVLATGLTCWFLYQALLNIGVVTNTIPPTGIPLPFISYGGSGTVTALAGTGILLSISKAWHGRARLPRVERHRGVRAAPGAAVGWQTGGHGGGHPATRGHPLPRNRGGWLGWDGVGDAPAQQPEADQRLRRSVARAGAVQAGCGAFDRRLCDLPGRSGGVDTAHSGGDLSARHQAGTGGAGARALRAEGRHHDVRNARVVW
jgi:cell division protein FtsW